MSSHAKKVLAEYWPMGVIGLVAALAVLVLRAWAGRG